MQKTYESYSVRFSSNKAAEVIERMEKSVLGVDRDLVILSALVLAIGKSDPDAIQNSQRLGSLLASLSEHLAWIISLPTEIDQKKAN